MITKKYKICFNKLMFEYQEASDYWLKQHQAHWLHTEVPMMRIWQIGIQI